MNYYTALMSAGFIGVCVALEPTINSSLGKIITPKLAALHSFITGIIVMILLNLADGGFGQYRNITKAPPYLWFGGLLGVAIVYLGAKVAPVIGVASMVTIMVSVQLMTSIAIDTFGLLGANRVPLDAGRIIGIILLIIGSKLIIK